MNYIETAVQIYHWLTTLQIKQKLIQATINNGCLNFSLEHPVKGRISVEEPLPEKSYFRSQGIGLKLTEIQKDNATIEVYDAGGIWDPIDQSVPGDHYAATHYALLGAVIYKHFDKNSEILANVKDAIEFHLRTSKDEYYFDDYDYHWDFQNYAFLETYNLLEDALSEIEKRTWVRGLKGYQENTRNRHTNWIAMRSYSALQRSRLFHSVFDNIRFRNRLSRVIQAKKKDGCYDDFPDVSRPIQYHVFTVVLLHRIYLIKPTKKLRQHILSGIYYFCKFIDPDGCFNYLGRGQEQIFGYGIALYVLEAAKLLEPDKKEYFEFSVTRIWNYLSRFKTNDHFPLVLNNRKDEEKFGWYDYHHTTVYNAFLGVWLGLSFLLREEVSGSARYRENYFCYFKPSQMISVSKDEYFIAFSGGKKSYLTEVGLTPLHIWFKEMGAVFSCPGGPSKEKFGKLNPVEHVEKNYLAPLFQLKNGEWLTPAKKEFDLSVSGNDKISFFYNYGDFSVHRNVLLEPRKIIFEDKIKIEQDVHFKEIRYFNFPLAIEEFKFDISAKNTLRLKKNDRQLLLEIIATNFGANNFETGEEIKTARGMAKTVMLRRTDFACSKDQELMISFQLSRKQ